MKSGARIAVAYASLATKKPKIDPVPVVKIIHQPKAKVPAYLENLFTSLSNIVHIDIANTTANPE